MSHSNFRFKGSAIARATRFPGDSELYFYEADEADASADSLLQEIDELKEKLQQAEARITARDEFISLALKMLDKADCSRLLPEGV